MISLHLFAKAHEVRDGFKRQNFKRTNKPYIFRGLVRCAECGCTISPEIKKGKYVYYHCTNYHGNCKNVLCIKEEDLIKQIKPTLLDLQMENDAIEELKRELRGIHEGEQADYELNVNAINKKIKTIDQRMKVMYEDRLDERITPEDYDEKVKDSKKQKKDLLDQLGDYTEADATFNITASKILNISSKACELFESSEPEEKTQLLNFILQNFSLSGKNLLFETKIPFSGILACKNDLQGSHALGLFENSEVPEKTSIVTISYFRTCDCKEKTFYLKQKHPSKGCLHTSKLNIARNLRFSSLEASALRASAFQKARIFQAFLNSKRSVRSEI